MIGIRDVEAFVQPYYADRDVMHGMAHVKRLHTLATEIARDCDHDPQILLLGAYLHGIVYRLEDDIRRFLSKRELSEDTISKTIQAAWESQKEAGPETIEGTILHDAHLLEGGKTFIVTKCLVTGTARGQTLEETIAYMEVNVLGKFHCYLPQAQIRYVEKEAFAREFLDDLRTHLR